MECPSYLIQGSLSLFISNHARMEPSSNLSPGKLCYISPSTPPPHQVNVCPVSAVVFYLGKFYLILTWRTPPFWAEFWQPAALRWKNMPTRVSALWIIGWGGQDTPLPPAHSYLLKIASPDRTPKKKAACLQETPWRMQGYTHSFEMGVFTFGWFGWTEDRISFFFFY